MERDHKQQREALLKEIAMRHGIAIGDDDPIMIMHTIISQLLDDSVATQQKLLEGFRRELEDAAHTWDQNAKGKAERVLNAALSASRDAMDQQLTESGRRVAAEIRSTLDKAITRQTANSVRIAQLNIIASCITAAAALMLLWVAL